MSKNQRTKAFVEQMMDFIIQHKFTLSMTLVAVFVAMGGLYFLPSTTEQQPYELVAVALPETTTVVAETSAPVVAVQSAEKQTAKDIPLPEDYKPVFYKAASFPVSKLIVNGNTVAVFPNEKDAYRVLDTFKLQYVDENSELVDVVFVEHVEVVSTWMDTIEFNGYDKVEPTIELVTKGTNQEKKHVVQQGENYWIIAQNYGIDPEDLEEANPHLDPSAIQIGEVINLVAPTPILTVRTIEKIEYNEDIEYEVVYEDTDSLYIGETRTKSAGVYGEKAITASLIKENGVVIARTVLSEKVISEPVDKVVYNGILDPPPRMGTGILGYPLSYWNPVSSEFGDTYGRWIPHTGIDVQCHVGTPVLAADGGVVVAAGWASSYGFRIIIDHGGNISTLYAHCSELYVVAGDQVFKGQTIAASGSTGYSTGPHLHFEVRVNGVYQNPRNYVNF